MVRERPRELIQSVDRAIDVLEVLAFSDGSCSLAEISGNLSMNKSTVHRILATLVYRGYVQHELHTNRYKIGIRLFEVGNSVSRSFELRQLSRFLNELMQRTQETIHLGILDETETVYIDKVESKETIRMYSNLGGRVPSYCTGLGKVLLAHSGPEIVERIISSNLHQFTDNTITDPETLKEHLKEIRDQGYALDNEEHEENICCVAGPVLDNTGEIIAAFSIAGPKFRMNAEKIKDLIPVVIEFSRKMSATYGYALRCR